MSDILIRGMELPTDSPVYLTVCPSGGVYVHTYERGYGALVKSQYRVIELPEHGDLIDRSKLSFVCGGTAPAEMDYVRRYVVDGMPVIIPASEEKGGV